MKTVMTLESKIRWLKRHHYELKHSNVGWWVDGACGFLVEGYHKHRYVVIHRAYRHIKQVMKKGTWPTWRTI